jgi:SsrA-binding protein
MTGREGQKKTIHDYTILDKWEAGIQLQGAEVKSIREGRISIKESFVRIDRGEAYLFNAHIQPYSNASTHVTLEPTKKRKLLMHKEQIKRLIGQIGMKGHTVVPLSVYFSKRGIVKLEIALCKGKKAYDKRQSIKKRDATRNIQQAMRSRQKR